MRFLIAISIFITSFSGFGQTEKLISLRATGNFNFKTKGLATNDAGIGLGIDASILLKNRLQIVVETSADRFIGDKLLILDSTGRENKSAAIYSIKVGPQFFVSKTLALSATYGPAWYTIREFSYSYDYGFKFSLIGFFGDYKRFVAKGFMVHLPVNNRNIQYFGLGAGYRFR